MKNIVVALFVLVSWSAVQAQAPIVVGLKAGPMWTQLEGRNVKENADPVAIYGAMLQLNLTNHVGVELDALFNQKKGDLVNKAGSTVANFRIAYMEFPLFVRLRYPVIEDKFYPGVYGGAYGAINTQNRFRDPDGFDYDDYEKPSKVDWGYVAGASLDYEIEKWSFNLDARYYIGKEAFESEEGAEVSFNSLAVFAGVGLVLGR